MKLRLLILGFVTTSLISMDPPPQLIFPMDIDEDSKSNDKTLQDFVFLQQRARKLINIVPKITSHQLDVQIARIHSEGEVVPLDCESINSLIRRECSHATQALQAVKASHTITPSRLAYESYNQARMRYQNALHWIIKAFALKCYKTMDILHRVLTEFTDIETEALHIDSQRKLDQKTLELFAPLQNIIKRAEDKLEKSVPLIAVDNTRDLLQRLEVPESSSSRPPKIGQLAIRSLQEGNKHLIAAKELLEKLQDPTLESLENIERTFFIAFEHYVMAYQRDTNQGLKNAKIALQEIEALETFKRNKFGKIGQRHALAKEIIENAQNPEARNKKNKNALAIADEASSAVSKTPSYHSEASIVRGIREDATQDYRPVKNSDTKLRESEKAVKEKDEVLNPAPVRTSPLSLLKSAWKNCKKAGKGTGKGIKYVWNKLPFN